MTEEWRDIPGIPDYQASNLGGVRGMGRLVRVRGGYRRIKPCVLSCFPAKATGYPQVDIRKVRHSVHRLVALAWCEGYFEGAVVDHLNGVRSDNRAENLEWVTYSENSRRGFQMGRVNPFQGAFSAEHPASKPVSATCIKTGAKRVYQSAMDAVREGYDSSSISRCCHGENAYHKGHYWAFCDMNGIELTETRKGGWLDERAA